MIRYEKDTLVLHGNIPQLLTELIDNAVELAFMSNDELRKAAYESERDFDAAKKELKDFLDHLY